MLNLHRLLFRQDDPQSYHAEILPTDAQHLVLTEAKNAIRDHLRTAIAAASTQIFGMARRVEPRFRTQGSWSYRTCLQPAHVPPQEMDWDFGVYLPATIWQGTQPGFAAKAYFELVERTLRALCRERGWHLLTGAGCKDTCIRIQITSWAHIDVPLYAAPEKQFVLISERARSMSASQIKRRQDDILYLAEDAAAGEEPDFPWDELEHIVLATRGGEWKPSDPNAVSRWYTDAIDEHGEQLRRVCRYLKGWRDFHWPDGGGPSSLLLMICVTEGFESRWHRDDVALQDAAGRLQAQLLRDVHVLGIDNGVENFNRLSPNDRIAASELAKNLHWMIELSRSYGGSMKHHAVQNLQGVLGARVPSRPEFVELEGPSDQVRATPAITVVPPVVRQTKAG